MLNFEKLLEVTDVSLFNVTPVLCGAAWVFVYTKTSGKSSIRTKWRRLHAPLGANSVPNIFFLNSADDVLVWLLPPNTINNSQRERERAIRGHSHFSIYFHFYRRLTHSLTTFDEKKIFRPGNLCATHQTHRRTNTQFSPKVILSHSLSSNIITSNLIFVSVLHLFFGPSVPSAHIHTEYKRSSIRFVLTFINFRGISLRANWYLFRFGQQQWINGSPQRTKLWNHSHTIYICPMSSRSIAGEWWSGPRRKKK